MRAGLRAFLERRPEFLLVSDVGTLDDALVAIVERVPDIVVTDLNLPAANGGTMIEVLKRAGPECGVLVYTARAGAECVRSALEAGARGYLLKSSPLDALALALQTIAADRVYLDPTLDSAGGDSAGLENLSSDEVRVLRMAAYGYSNKEVASDLEVSVKTVEVRKRDGMAKLGLSNRVKLISFAVTNGWI